MRLHVERGPNAGQVFELKAGERALAGRGRDCSLQLSDGRLSRRHFELAWDGSRWQLTDLGSSNGTLVNGLAVRSVSLHDGDRIEAGDSALRVALTGRAPVRAPLRARAVQAPAAPAVAGSAPPPLTREPLEVFAFFAPSSDPPPSLRPAPGSRLAQLALVLAEGGDSPLYALIDGASACELARSARVLGHRIYTLCEGGLAQQIAQAGPLLIPLGDAPLPFLSDWAAARPNAGVLLESAAELPVLYAHLCALFEVVDARGNAYFRRFYDPRVLRPLLASSAPAELAALFGPVRRWIAADETGSGFGAFGPPDGRSR